MSDALPLAVTMGDPAGVGPMIALKAHQAMAGERPFYVIASREVMAKAALALSFPGGGRIEVIKDPSEARAAFASGLPVLPIDGPTPKPGAPDLAAAPAIIESLRLAVEHARTG